MNKWMRRAAGTVGLAGGAWLLGGGIAHAAAPAGPVVGPATSHLLKSLFTPAGGPANLALSPDRRNCRPESARSDTAWVGYDPGRRNAGRPAHGPHRKKGNGVRSAGPAASSRNDVTARLGRATEVAPARLGRATEVAPGRLDDGPRVTVQRPHPATESLPVFDSVARDRSTRIAAATEDTPIFNQLSEISLVAGRTSS